MNGQTIGKILGSLAAAIVVVVGLKILSNSGLLAGVLPDTWNPLAVCRSPIIDRRFLYECCPQEFQYVECYDGCEVDPMFAPRCD